MNKKATRLVALLMSAALVTVTGCSKKEDPTTAAALSGKNGKTELPRPVRFMQVGMSSLSDISYLPGEVRPRFEQRYGFRVPG